MVLKDSSKIMLGSQEVQRIYLGSQKVYENFPAGYRKVDWIQGSGTQYINTGVEFDGHYKYEVDCEFANENYNQLFGMYYSYNHAFMVNANGNIQCKCDRYDNLTDSGISSANRVLCFADEENKTVKVDNFTHTYGTFSPLNSNFPVLLFATWNYWNNSFYDYGKGRIYNFKWYVNNVLIRDMQPCVRISDGVAGMLDLVNKVFYTNAGTGNFVVPS